MPLALITGASRGLGRSAAEHLARGGWDVLGTYRSARAEADELVEAVHGLGRTAAVLPFDAERPETIEAFVAEVGTVLEERFGGARVDALVNNAGVGLTVPFADTTPEQFDRIFTVQVKTPFFLTQRLLPLLADGGQILNVSSGLARFVGPGNAAYAASKGAIEVLTRYEAQELGARGIRANVIAPGAIANDFNGGAVRDNEQYNRAVSASVALGRPGRSEEIGAAIRSLLSPDLAWMNGNRVEVSGGQRL